MLTKQLMLSLLYFLLDNVECKPQSNNVYKLAAPPGTMNVSIKGSAFHMLQQKLTIAPVTLHSEN